MKRDNFNKKYLTFAVYVATALLIIALLVGMLINIDAVKKTVDTVLSVLSPIFYAVIFVLIVYPVIKLYDKRVFCIVERKKPHPKLRAGLSVAAGYITVLLVFLLIIVVIVSPLRGAIINLQANFQTYLSLATSWLDEQSQAPSIFASQFEKVRDFLEDAINLSFEGIKNIIPQVLDIGGKIATEASNIVLGAMISVYMVCARGQLKHIARKIMLAFISPKATNSAAKFVRRSYQTLADYTIGRITFSLITMAVFYVILLLSDVQFYYFISIIIGLSCFIPAAGITVGLLLGALFVFTFKSNFGVWFILIYVAYQVLMKLFLKPRIIKKSVMPSLGFSLVSLIVMKAVFGSLGLVFAVPLALIFVEIFNWIISERERRNKLRKANADDEIE